MPSPDPELRREFQRRYREKHRASIRERDRRHKARKRWDLVMELEAEQAGMCAICGDPLARPPEARDVHDLHVDHKLAKCLGGGDERENLQLVHSWCNESKGARQHYGNGRYGQDYRGW